MRYKGSIENAPNHFVLDQHHIIETGRLFPVCGNTYNMLKESRFAKHFDFYGDTQQHFGIFEGCGTVIPFDNSGENSSTDGACC